MTHDHPRLQEWEAQAAFLASVGATQATWDSSGTLTALVIPQRQPLSVQPRPQPIPQGATPAKDLKAMMEKRKAEAAARHHEVMFAATSTRPPFIPKPTTTDPVPRALRAKEEEAKRGPKRKRR